MKVHQKGNITIIKDSNSDLDTFVTNLTNQYKTFEGQNLIIDLSACHGLNIKSVNVFLALAKQFKKAKKSFIIVLKDFDFNKVSASINVVPTVQEAHDIIEMEEIERDLGF
jgi:hypothetical protein